MRVLYEYGNKRVDIKTPISMRQKVDETPEMLAQLINEALGALGFGVNQKRASFDVIVKELSRRAK